MIQLVRHAALTRRLAAETLVLMVSFGLAIATLLVTLSTSGTQPYGQTALARGDYAPQYLPFHSHLRDLLTGEPFTSWGFTWSAGYGVPALPDYATYTGGPFAPLVLLWPAGRVETAMIAIILLKVGLAAAAMTWALRRLTKAPVWLTILLSVAYACSSWLFQISIYTPMWIDGSIWLPLMLVASIWCGQRRHFWFAVTVVALAWWSNFYVAYMASLTLVLFTLVDLAARWPGWRNALERIARLAAAAALGLGATAVILVPAISAIGTSAQYPGVKLEARPMSELLLKYLPQTEGIAKSPALFTSTATLVLAIGVLVASHLTRRERWVWFIALIAMVLGTNLPPIALAFNAFDHPNGNPFRFSFVIAAWLTVTAARAWPKRSYAPHWRALLPGTVTVAVIIASVLIWPPQSSFVHRTTASLWLPAITVAVLWLMSLAPRRIQPWVVLALTTIMTVDIAGTGAFIMGRTSVFLKVGAFTTNTLNRERAVTQAAAQRQWPRYRLGTTVGSAADEWVRNNDGMLLGTTGTGYYTSTMPNATAVTLKNLGMVQRSGGRMLDDYPDPVLDAIMATPQRPVGRVPTGPRQLPAPVPAMPMVRVAAPTTLTGPSPAQIRNDLLGVEAYTPGEMRIVASDRPVVGEYLKMGWRTNVTMEWSCQAGTVFAWQAAGVLGAYVPQTPGYTSTRRATPGALQQLWTSNGRPLRVILYSTSNYYIPQTGLWCLNPAKVRQAVTATETPQISISGASVEAAWPQPRTGDFVVATTAQPGWACTLDGRSVPVRPRSGLLAVNGTGRSLNCLFTQPGLKVGAAISTVTGLAVVGLLLVGWLGRRRRAIAVPHHPRGTDSHQAVKT